MVVLLSLVDGVHCNLYLLQTHKSLGFDPVLFSVASLSKNKSHTHQESWKMPWHIGKKTVFSSQEATELIFMDTESEGEDIDLGEDFLGKCNIDSDSDIEQDEEESSEDEEITFTRKKKGIIFFYTKF